MRSFELETWDDGRLTVNRDYADVLEAGGLDRFAALMDYTGGRVAKNVLRERTTIRLELEHPRPVALYLKRHTPPPWKEYVKPLLRLRRPMLGARHEWNAILAFHAAGLPTMTPVAVGEYGRCSLLVTAALDGCRKLSEWLAELATSGTAEDRVKLLAAIDGAAALARRMHAAGIHHQDFYLTHLLATEDRCRNGLPAGDDSASGLYVIDLGRAARKRRLSRHWIVKDLAQFCYSVRRLGADLPPRFFESWLGRTTSPADARLLRAVERKSLAIDRHSRKNAL